MKERGIIFNAEMVRAILDGRKTQTRRVVKHQRHSSQEIKLCDDGFFHWSMISAEKPLSAINYEYGRVGDRLWVRETFCNGRIDEHDAEHPNDRYFYVDESSKGIVYREKCLSDRINVEDVKWTPSIHMPRSASRITLEITDVRVERLQAASDDDFKAEGYPLERALTGGSTDAFCWFRHLWDSVSKPDCNFESNPWVWVIEFKRV
ncbi:hypothetical protein AB7315_18170 [Providencia manganoxydans]|uniref:hypothetical protein n=1 Tax=Providencia manganoxydans TaxID=2923283 RepID=UPI0034E3CE0B